MTMLIFGALGRCTLIHLTLLALLLSIITTPRFAFAQGVGGSGIGDSTSEVREPEDQATAKPTAGGGRVTSTPTSAPPPAPTPAPAPAPASGAKGSSGAAPSKAPVMEGPLVPTSTTNSISAATKTGPTPEEAYRFKSGAAGSLRTQAQGYEKTVVAVLLAGTYLMLDV
ncbi:MAG: hypothetical protein DHS80DRAFT_31652 [Piptocephalis tieghemiana]|nr:MAG: hypothetical protein DHS80DRAFT_31652 [Piptocephalis tieghemiana]